MRIVMFYHSLRSDWNNGIAHFLRGVAGELLSSGHEVVVYEASDGWSAQNLVAERGSEALDAFRTAYPTLDSVRYDIAELDLDEALDGADLVLVHEWNPRELVRRIGEHRRLSHHYRLLFHDTHQRAVTDEASMARYDLRQYDGVLAFGDVLRQRYLHRGWTQRVWTWHEAADVRVFRPRASRVIDAEPYDVIWVGNWGDDERATELREFLIDPVQKLRCRTRVYGAHYTDEARRILEDAGIEYGGWLANHEIPEVLARARMTVHIPSRACARTLPGIPSIGMFEALACGVPLISAPWDDAEGLFTVGEDYLVAPDGDAMGRQMHVLRSDPGWARALAERGRHTILARHTCAHRVAELLDIARQLGVRTAPSHPTQPERRSA